MKPPNIDLLKIVTEFQSVPDDQLQWLISQGETVEVEQGEFLFNVGEPVDTSYIVLDGKMRVATVQSGQEKELRILDPGQVTGYLPYSRATVTPAFCVALKKSWVFKCSKARLISGFDDHYELIEAMVHMMLGRVRVFTSIQQQNEKMLALGKLSAGLAHELNNPATAITRASALLHEQVCRLPGLYEEVAGLRLTQEKVKAIKEVVVGKTNATATSLNMMQRAELEDSIDNWLLENGLQDLDPDGLVESCFTIDELNVFKDSSSAEELPVLLEWISNYLITEKMSEDIQVSSERISSLVGAVKNFTYMDKNADRQLIDIHEGIRNTLIMLKYKLRNGNIHVVEHYDDSMPKVIALPGAMNQIWTNIIDNAIDAMEENGKGNLEISSSHDERFVKVKIKDDGTGISEDIREKIFNPFFTTKKIGQGTGLGLDVVSRILLQLNGEVKLKSKPGETEFEISFPF